jgi:hypothetical protein
MPSSDLIHYARIVALAIVVAACDGQKAAPADSQAVNARHSDTAAPGASDTVPVSASADVAGYFAVKKDYGKAGKLLGGGLRPTKEIADLDARLPAIIGPVVVDGHTVSTRISLGEAQYDGQEGGEELDGEAFTLAGARVIASTRALLSGWLATHGIDTTGSALEKLEADRALTWALSPTAAAEQYANLRKHAELPGDVFIAKLVLFAQDRGPWPPENLVVGLARDERVYLISTRARWVLQPPAECPFIEQTFYECYDRVAAGQPEYQQLVAQVKEIAAMFSAKMED